MSSYTNQNKNTNTQWAIYKTGPVLGFAKLGDYVFTQEAVPRLTLGEITFDMATNITDTYSEQNKNSIYYSNKSKS